MKQIIWNHFNSILESRSVLLAVMLAENGRNGRNHHLKYQDASYLNYHSKYLSNTTSYEANHLEPLQQHFGIYICTACCHVG